MKKSLISLLLALLALLSLTVCAYAEARLDYVTDGTGLLTDSEKQELRDRAAAISDRYDFGVYVVIVDNYQSYVNGSISDFAEEVFHSYGLGRGEKEEGVLLAMSMSDRDYDIYAHGDFGNYAFTDYGKTRLASSFVDDFMHNDWAGGLRDYVKNCGDMLQKARDGNPVDIWIPDTVQPARRFDAFKAAVSLFIGTIFGGAAVGGMKHSMKTAVKQTRAENYVVNGGVKLTGRSDEHVNRTVSRTMIRQPSSSSGNRPGGGHFGGTTISGGHGGSHHSGKF